MFRVFFPAAVVILTQFIDGLPPRFLAADLVCWERRKPVLQVGALCTLLARSSRHFFFCPGFAGRLRAVVLVFL